MRLALFLMGEKGHASLVSILKNIGASAIRMVVGSRDEGVQSDYYEDIKSVCRESAVPFYDRRNAPEVSPDDYAMAISWRWMIRNVQNLVILHDSLLPRYRGFSPLVASLINGDKEIGVTALYGAAQYDTGDLISQRSLKISYPIKIKEAISQIKPLYESVSVEIASTIVEGKPLPRISQNDSEASYSLWRDDQDYIINWHWDAGRITRFIDALGFPYLGARTTLNGETAIISDAVEVPDVCIEDRSIGKVIFEIDRMPVVVCGRGLLKIVKMEGAGSKTLIPLNKFRSRFG